MGVQSCIESIIGGNATTIEVGCDDNQIIINFEEHAPYVNEEHVEGIKECIKVYADNSSISIGTYQDDSNNLFDIIIYDTPRGYKLSDYISDYMKNKT